MEGQVHGIQECDRSTCRRGMTIKADLEKRKEIKKLAEGVSDGGDVLR